MGARPSSGILRILRIRRYGEIHPNDPSLLFESGDDKYLVEDLYCVTPGCSCRDAQVFLHRIVGRKCVPAGSFVIDVRSWKVTHGEGGRPLAPAQIQIWKDWKRSHPNLQDVLERRRKTMQRFGSEFAKFQRGAASPAPAKGAEQQVGRNAPCPCGSGRKYKKCCMKH